MILANSILNLRSKNLHIHIINPNDKDFILINQKQESFNNNSDSSLTFSYENTKLEENAMLKKVYYASSRFLHHEFFNTSKCLIVDIDSLFLKDFDYPEEEIGIVLEPHRAISMQIKAGFFYFTKQSREFLNFNNKILLELTWKTIWWGVDQFSLFISYEKYKKDFNFYYFKDNFFSKKLENKPIYFPRGVNKNQEEFLKTYNLFLY